jgi:hypothetical protein
VGDATLPREATPPKPSTKFERTLAPFGVCETTADDLSYERAMVVGMCDAVRTEKTSQRGRHDRAVVDPLRTPPAQRENELVSENPDLVSLSSDEIEVACDLLWFVRRREQMPAAAEALWQRLQPVRHGDYGGPNLVELSADEARTLIEVAATVEDRVTLDGDETGLVARLRSRLN